MLPLKTVVVVILGLHMSIFFVVIFSVINTQEENFSKKILPDEETVVVETPEEMFGLVMEMNVEQRVYNKDKFPNNIDLVIVIQVHDRPSYLQELINSLATTPSINSTLLIFSHDVVNPLLDTIIQEINFAKVLQIFYPYSNQINPETFPGPDIDDCRSEAEMLVHDCPNIDFKDSYGNFRDAHLAQIKHHWWWKANFVFGDVKILKNYTGTVLFVEEDHYLTPDFIHCLNLMKKMSRYFCERCWFFSLGLQNRVNFVEGSDHVVVRNTVENLGLAFNRTIWGMISKYREHFCKFDDYNWDWSLRNVMDSIPGEKSSMVMVASRVFHIGSCGTHSEDEVCNSTELIQEFKNRQTNLFPDSLSLVFDEDMPRKIRNNGGWGDPRDHEFCMEM